MIAMQYTMPSSVATKPKKMHPLPLRDSRPSKRDNTRASNSTDKVSGVRGLEQMLWEPRAGNA